MNRVSIYPLNMATPRELGQAIERIGADPRCNVYFQPKHRVRHLYVTQADFRAAAYMKQELLARGGDAVVGKHVIDGKASHSDVLLVATDGQLKALLAKMEAMDCWGLKEIRTTLRETLERTATTCWTLPLPEGRELQLGTETKIMGILNLTPDSFHSASRVAGVDDLLRRAEKMLLEGADVLDLGAESTRPGAAALSEEEERARLIPALEAVRKTFPKAVLSVDTYKGSVALAAADAGADMINDVGGLDLDPGMALAVAKTGLPYVLSHIKGTPSDMQDTPPYLDLLGELNAYFQAKIAALQALGVGRDKIVIDPGLGFGKKGGDNLHILKELESLGVLGLPLLVGHSRKKFTGTVTGAEGTDDRLTGTVALSALLEGRAQMIRVHDVRENMQALRMARAVRGASV